MLYIYGQIHCLWEIKMPTEGCLSIESLVCAIPTFLKEVVPLLPDFTKVFFAISVPG